MTDPETPAPHDLPKTVTTDDGLVYDAATGETLRDDRGVPPPAGGELADRLERTAEMAIKFHEREVDVHLLREAARALRDKDAIMEKLRQYEQRSLAGIRAIAASAGVDTNCTASELLADAQAGAREIADLLDPWDTNRRRHGMSEHNNITVALAIARRISGE